MNGVNHVCKIEPITVEQINRISMNIHECLYKVTRILNQWRLTFYDLSTC